MPPDAQTIHFVALDANHYGLVRRWLETPHMRQWWGDPETEFGHIRDMVEGRDTTRPFVIEHDGRPIGYIQFWYVGHHQNAEWLKDNPWLADLPADAIGVDMSIGEAHCLSRGIGSAAMAAFVAKLRQDGFTTIVIDPDPANARAVRAYEKAGFVPISHLKDKTPGALFMQHRADHEWTAS